MNRQEIDALVKTMNVDTATGPVDTRVQQITVRLLADLFQAIEDLDISQSELWKGLEYFTDAGQANELGLLAAGLGLEHYLDLRADEADAKAGIYLAAITALIPVLVSLLPTLWSDKSNKWLGCLGLFIFVWAVAYLLRAGAWAFRTLQVAGFAQLGPGELVKSWNKRTPKAALAKQLSSAVLYNYPLVNRKVSGIKMTHEYLLRAFLSFTILLVLQVMWPVGTWVVDEGQKLISPNPLSPLIMCFS